MTVHGGVAADKVLDKAIILNAIDFRKGATAPTEATIGTTPTVPALLFDAVGELVNANIMIPLDVDFTVDPRLILTVSLANAETNLDSIDWTMDYVAARENSTGDGPDKTSTQITASKQVTTGNGLAVNDVYTVEFTFDRNDANNPLNAGTTALFIELHLTNVIGVGAVHLLAACFAYQGSH